MTIYYNIMFITIRCKFHFFSDKNISLSKIILIGCCGVGRGGWQSLKKEQKNFFYFELLMFQKNFCLQCCQIMVSDIAPFTISMWSLPNILPSERQHSIILQNPTFSITFQSFSIIQTTQRVEFPSFSVQEKSVNTFKADLDYN